MTEFTYWRRWRTILGAANPLPGAPLDPVSKWMLITRAYVHNMTLVSALIGMMLAIQVGNGVVNPVEAIIVVIGLVLAHAANNMINDFFDFMHGVDTDDYPRLKYGPHPIVHKLISKKGLLGLVFLCNLVDLLIAIYFYQKVGIEILYFVFAGILISVFYVAKPVRLKNLGLGELGIFLIWGPLMVGGTFLALTGDNSNGEMLYDAMLFSVPYGLVVMAVVMGKHMDKYHDDREKPVHTLPVLIGLPASSRITQFLILFFFPATAFIVWQGHSLFLLVVFFALPRAIRSIKMIGRPVPGTPQEAFGIAYDAIPNHLKKGYTPDNPPDHYPIWPLWYVAWAFHFVRLGGALFVLGLVMDTLISTGIIPL
ncbi:MAG: prenyltransferase [Candidatus Thermoplasmatota archaeon]|jgi:1,4-dihydroxy-2-naphthoate octaprenyltransferase|nr:prenyltransferase [Candidatus Thermoplasmatota archaeon]